MRYLLLLTSIVAAYIGTSFVVGYQNPVKAQELPYNIQRGVAYKRIGESVLNVDICSPKQNAVKRPTLVFFHGGGFRNGERTQGINLLCELVTARGYQLVSADYRLYPDAVYPAQLDDGQYVIRWLRHNAETYHVDENRIIVVGTSAGATLSAVIATRSETRNPYYGLKQYSSKPQGAIVLAGVYDFTNEEFLGGWDPRSYLLSSKLSYIKAFSAVNYVSFDDGPFLLLHGTEDKTNLLIQSQRMRLALTKKNVPARLVTFTGIHAGGNFLKPEAQQAILAYLRKYFPIVVRTDVTGEGQDSY